MLKLTRVDVNPTTKTVDDYEPVWINPSQIVSITREAITDDGWNNAEFTTINLRNISIDVKETPEEISAMG